MQQWVIYKDSRFSRSPYSARNFNGDGFTGNELESTTLEGVRAQLPPSFTKRFEASIADPLIVEIWQRLD